MQSEVWRRQYIGDLAQRLPKWDWADAILKYRRKPRRVELAIWHKQQLCGLVMGRVSARRIVASIHLIEASPNDHPLSGSITLIATRYLSTLAGVLSCKETSIDRPEPSLIEWYERLGFKHRVVRGKKVVRLMRSEDFQVVETQTVL
jgi:hypothetical protein